MSNFERKDFLTEMPPIPEDEFCVYGTVRTYLYCNNTARTVCYV